jgi:coenzyme F420 hydrogenase subunit beta
MSVFNVDQSIRYEYKETPKLGRKRSSWIMQEERSHGQQVLIDKVINPGLCVRCGACVGLCPYLHYHDGKVIVQDVCHADRSRCLQICPRADYEGTAPVNPAENEEIGSYLDVFASRANDQEIRKKAQYGGTVSCILIYALEKMHLNSAVLTDRGNGVSPYGTIARTGLEVLGCAGSRYSGSAGLSVLNSAIEAGEEKLGVVGVPCQMEALARMGKMEPDGQEMSGHIALRIGLFCTWAVDYRRLVSFLRMAGVEGPVQKYDIPPPPSEIFQIHTENGRLNFSLNEIRSLVQKGCTLCQDMTAELSDLSVGTLEGREGWNTVLVRTDAGARLIHEAIAAGRLETDRLPAKNLEHLKEAARNKRERARRARLAKVHDVPSAP